MSPLIVTATVLLVLVLAAGCSLLFDDALQDAIDDYRRTTGSPRPSAAQDFI